MQLMQIRQQIELLALQAKEIHKRKELSMLVYGSYLLSMVSPKEWGSATGPYKAFVGAVQLLADHTWKGDLKNYINSTQTFIVIIKLLNKHKLPRRVASKFPVKKNLIFFLPTHFEMI